MSKSESQAQILAEIATLVGRSHRTLPDDAVTGFMAMKGRLYNRELMVVGRAVNGWTRRSWTPEALASDEAVHEFVSVVQQSVTAPESCPMQWVSKAWGSRALNWPSNWACVGNQEYNTRRSAFWRVIRNLVDELGLADINNDSWPSHLVWSNLYKVSPAAGRNPPARMRSLQVDKCVSLLKLELEIYKPKRLLLLTGKDWAAPFLQQTVANMNVVQGSRLVHADGTLTVGADDTCAIVVAAHPERKPEATWVREVLQSFQSQV